MSNHTKIWNKKKALLLEKEKELKNELESVSSLFEGRTKTILIISAITGGVALIGYLGYKAFSSPSEIEKAKKKVKKSKGIKKVRSGALLGSLLTERLVNTGLKYAEKQIGQIIKGDSSKK